MEPKASTEAMASVRTTATRGVPRVSATQGPGQGSAFALTQSLATVGRHETNDLVLADPGVSGVHLEFTVSSFHAVPENLEIGLERVRLSDNGCPNPRQAPGRL